MPVPSTDPLTPEKVALGRRLFSDATLSADGSVSCATCHRPDQAFADGRPIAHGVHDAEGARNTPSLVDIGYGRSFFWDGRAASLEEQVMGPLLNVKEMGLTREEVEARTGLAAGDVAAALASYVRTIRSVDSRYDWFASGQDSVLTDLERRGLDVFRGRGQCGACHGGPRFTDEQFHNTGVGWDHGRLADEGRYAVSHDERDHGAFKTPSLRDVALTAPYMHDGSVATLEAVVDFYSRGGRRNPYLDPRVRPVRFTPEESAALVAFLKTLTGHVVEGF
jgi:cytochrome c peroxidase